ncbi:MAG: hypothetical protein HRU09_13715 [Oligoflexales bacterium]|nr:hypothetical protein [Oligoflexales bacterium]
MNQVKYKLSLTICFLTACFMSFSCNTQSGNSSNSSQQRSSGDTSKGNGLSTGDGEEGSGTDEASSGSDANTKIYLSPFEAKALVERDVSLGEAEIIEDFKVPRLKITFDKADFVKVLRCAASYKMQTSTGEDIRHLAGRPGQQSAMEWAWAFALEDRRKCKVVGLKIVSNDFADLTAPKGEYYYVVNPCVLSEHSVLNEEGCSYNLTLTYPVMVSDSFREEVRQKNIELSQAESSLNANLANAKQLAKKIEIQLTACENMVAKDQALLNFKKGIVQLGFLAVGAAIGGVIAGPNGAVMAGQMAGTIGAQYFFTKALNQPAYIVDPQNGFAQECIDPSVVATTEEQRKEATKHDPTNNASHRGKYEEEYQVQALTKKLQNMLGPEGPIARDTARVQDILKELYALETRVVTLDKAYAEAANLGIDVNDASTFPGAADEIFGP